MVTRLRAKSKSNGRKASTIGGGTGNLIEIQQVSQCWCSSPASVGTIAGGVYDTIGSLDGRWYPVPLGIGYASPIMGSIGGGLKNTVNGMYGAVGGGYENHALGLGSAIPGGLGLQALDFQTVVGRYNANDPYRSGLNHTEGPRADTVTGQGDQFLFIVGNGTMADSAHRSNAYTVSDNGHSTVSQTLLANGSPQPPDTRSEPTYGARYQDNGIYAWGSIPMMTPPQKLYSPTGLPQTFGVDSVQCLAGGQYNVFYHLVDNQSGNNIGLSQVTITVTIVGNVCDWATASAVSTNMFSVFIHKMASSCQEDYQPFMFQLCGRR